MSTHLSPQTSDRPRSHADRLRHPFAQNMRQIGTWERIATAMLVAVVILGATAGIWRFSDNFGQGDRGDQQIPFSALTPPGDGGNGESVIPVVTIQPDEESSNIPPPTADECVVIPMTREQVIEHLTAANVVTWTQYEKFDEPQVPSSEDAQAIMQTYREWTACGLWGRSWAYSLQFETPWFTAFNAPLFSETDPSRTYNPDVPPVSAQRIEDWTDIVLADEMLWATPENQLLVTEGAEGGARPTIFPDEISMVGPDHAVATAYWISIDTLELQILTPRILEFVKIDGVWLIDFSLDGGRG